MKILKTFFLICGSAAMIIGIFIPNTVHSFEIGGGGQTLDLPDMIRTEEPTDIIMTVTATGEGGPIKGRFKNISLYYKLVGENTYTALLAQPIDLPDNFKTVQSKSFQSESYKFTIPPYPIGTKGEIEYYTKMTFDGYTSKTDGHKKTKISE